MIPDNKLEPDYCYEPPTPELWEIQCPEGKFVDCWAWMNRTELADHLRRFHPDCRSDPEPYFEQERERRFS